MNNQKKKIGIIEDDTSISEGIELILGTEKYEFRHFFCLNEVEEPEKLDIIILDVNLPDGSGFDFLKEFRKNYSTPVLILTANNTEMDEVTGFRLGADDYVTKPFSMPVFLRKVNALMRRNDTANSSDSNPLCICGDIVINKDTMEVLVGSKPVILTVKEFDLLLTLVRNPGRIFTREMLLDLLWDYDSLVDERIVDSHVKNLRHKMGGEYIETVRGRGYRIAKKDN